jgi:hypothetical protein
VDVGEAPPVFAAGASASDEVVAGTGSPSMVGCGVVATE